PWLHFETFVTEEHNMLPPDNFQEVPAPVVAARTSPTNIGMYLLSTVAARDFGWISLTETADRLDRTLATMEKMERYRGHLFNWYETRTLKPLHPLYISSVDSGNLAGHLIAVAAACDAWTHALAAHLQGDFEGIIDVTRILEEKLERLARGLDEEIGSPASQELSLWAGKLEKVCEAHLNDSHTAGNGTPRLREKLASLCDRARQFAFEMDFSFLLREDRKLLSIGYRVEERQLDEACYDLLASEARLTSLFGI